jgi:hypothetical protein
MVTSIVSLTLAFAASATGWAGSPCGNPAHHHAPGGRILTPGPGYGWGFPGDNPDGYGWFDTDAALPLGADRTSDYFFPRYYAAPPKQLFLPSYYNPYLTRGQRYLPYAGCSGAHPAGGPPTGSAYTPVHPYQDTIGTGPRMTLPGFSGRIEAPPINSGGTGLTP